MSNTSLADLQPGDGVTRTLGAGGPTMELKVTGVTSEHILCGPWTFSRRNGAEIDEDLGWGEQQTGSYIVPHTS